MLVAALAWLWASGSGCGRWDFEPLAGSEALAPADRVLSGPSCGEGSANGDESSVDCGGACARCGSDAGCGGGSQCSEPARCGDGGCSTVPSCSDGVQNQDETDVDCGGVCGPCQAEPGCNGPSECSSGVCQDFVCRAPTCADGVRNQDETSADCGGACGPACSLLQAGLIHRYRFDGTGTLISDSVGSAHGLLINAVLSGSGSAALAGGSSGQYVDLPNGIISSLVDASFEVWLTWSGGPGWQKLFDFGTSSGGENNRTSSGQRFLTMSPRRALLDEALLLRHCPQTDCSSAAQWREAAATEALPAGVQKHVVGVFDDTLDELRLYVDGSRVAAQSTDGSLSELDDVNNWLGRSQYIGDPDLAAQLHEFRIYARALSDAEVQDSFHAGPDAASP